MLERRIVLVHLDARDDAGDAPVDFRARQFVLQPLHQQVADAALAVRDADVEPHRRHVLARVVLAQQDLAHHRAVAVRDDDFGRGLDHRAQRARGARGDFLLLRGGTADVLRVGRISADRDDETFSHAAIIALSMASKSLLASPPRVVNIGLRALQPTLRARSARWRTWIGVLRRRGADASRLSSPGWRATRLA
jgi:hypothetical protein